MPTIASEVDAPFPARRPNRMILELLGKMPGYRSSLPVSRDALNRFSHLLYSHGVADVTHDDVFSELGWLERLNTGVHKRASVPWLDKSLEIMSVDSFCRVLSEVDDALFQGGSWSPDRIRGLFEDGEVLDSLSRTVVKAGYVSQILRKRDIDKWGAWLLGDALGEVYSLITAECGKLRNSDGGLRNDDVYLKGVAEGVLMRLVTASYAQDLRSRLDGVPSGSTESRQVRRAILDDVPREMVNLVVSCRDVTLAKFKGPDGFIPYEVRNDRFKTLRYLKDMLDRVAVSVPDLSLSSATGGAVLPDHRFLVGVAVQLVDHVYSGVRDITADAWISDPFRIGEDPISRDRAMKESAAFFSVAMRTG